MLLSLLGFGLHVYLQYCYFKLCRNVIDNVPPQSWANTSIISGSHATMTKI